MHGHDPHFARGPVHLALDLDIACFDPGDEPRQRRDLPPLVDQGLFQQLVYWVLRLEPQSA